MWIQNYDPFGNPWISTTLAALPILTLLGLLISGRVGAWKSAAAGLAVAALVAWGAFGMPAAMVFAGAGVGVVFALFRIIWLIVAAVFLYDLVVMTGQFEVMKASIAGLSPDRRLQAVLVAFSFGAFIEGCAGFGAPVAISAAFLVGLGFQPFQAAVLCLVANTAPVAWGSLGIPLRTLGAVTGMDPHLLSVTTGRILPWLSAVIPFWLIVILAGFGGALEVWPALAVIGGSFAAAQFLWSNFVGFELVDIASSITSLAVGVVFLRFWRPRRVWRFDHDGEDSEPRPESALTRRLVARAWMPFGLLTLMVLVWGFPAVKAWGTPAVSEWLSGWSSWRVEVSVLHRKVAKGPELTGRSAPTDADLEAAVLDVAPVAATGTAVMLAAVLSGLLLGVSPRSQLRALGQTVWRMRPAIYAILCMLSLGFVTKYSGMDAVLGLAFTRTGPLLYPIFGTLLGWLGVALTGSDTSSNVLFGNLQRITATKLGLNPVLMGAANTTGGVMGKMIDAQSIVVSAAATGIEGREGEILRAVLRHSVALVLLVAAIVWMYAHAAPWMVAEGGG